MRFENRYPTFLSRSATGSLFHGDLCFSTKINARLSVLKTSWPQSFLRCADMKRLTRLKGMSMAAFLPLPVSLRATDT